MAVSNNSLRFINRDLCIDRDHLIIPETIIYDNDNEPGKALRPIFDALWQATGFPGSENYDADGNWTLKK